MNKKEITVAIAITGVAIAVVESAMALGAEALQTILNINEIGGDKK